MRKVVDFVWDFVDEVIPTVLFLVVTIMVATDIFLRNTLGRTIPNGIEIATYAFVWFIFLAAAGASRTGSHFQVSMLMDILPRRALMVLSIFVELVGLTVAVLMTKASWEYTARSWGRLSEGLEMPLGYFYMAFPVCFGLMALSYVRRIITHIKSGWRERS